MKKIISILFVCVLLFSLTPAVFAENPEKVVDNANLLSDSEETALTQSINKIVSEQSFDVVIVTTDTIDGKTPMEYANDYYDYNGYGVGPNKDGVLLLFSMEDRDWWISPTGYGITAITDYGIEVFGDNIVEQFSDGDYYEGFEKFVSMTEKFVIEAKTDKPYDVNHKYVTFIDYVIAVGIALLIALIIAFVVVFALKAQLKSVKFKAGANEYLNSGSFKLNNRSDLFLYRTVSKTKKVESSSSGGGSSTHTGSSGTSHGGGGGKF
ncbi:MAG: TPM domain-containing protein [Acutalibacteraceae bacterium]